MRNHTNRGTAVRLRTFFRPDYLLACLRFGCKDKQKNQYDEYKSV